MIGRVDDHMNELLEAAGVLNKRKTLKEIEDMAKIELSESWASDFSSDANEVRESGLAKRQRILSKQTGLSQSINADF